MACALTQGFVLDCKESLGGVKSVRFVEFDNASMTYAAGVATITMDAGKKFWLYSQVRETSSLTETITANVQNGTIFYQQEVVIVLNKLAAATRNEILLLAKNRLLAIVEDMNGNYWLLGAKNGLDITSGNSATGTASGDRNGYSLTFQAMEADPIWSVSAAAINAITN